MTGLRISLVGIAVLVAVTTVASLALRGLHD